MKIVSSIPGIGNQTAVTIITETNGFELIKNKRPLVSSVGLDIREKTSGTSVKSKPRISKRGNWNFKESNALSCTGCNKNR